MESPHFNSSKARLPGFCFFGALGRKSLQVVAGSVEGLGSSLDGFKFALGSDLQYNISMTRWMHWDFPIAINEWGCTVQELNRSRKESWGVHHQ